MGFGGVEFFAEVGDDGGFAAVGDEFDSVDEVFAPGSQLLDALVGWEVFEVDVMGGGFALGFKGVEGSLLLLESGEFFAFAGFVAGGGDGLMGDVS